MTWGKRLTVLLLLLACIGIVPMIQAQEQVTITVAVPEFVKQTVQDNIIDPFEAENPDIKVRIVSGDAPFFSPSDTEGYLEEFAVYAAAADVLIVNETSISVEATRNGYLLNLQPLISADPTLNPDDFYTQFWNSYQWDGGFWALPAAGDVIGILYVPARFDELGMFYPDEFWTLADLEDAIRQLSEVDETTGAINKTAYLDFTTNGTASLLMSLAGQGVYDPFSVDGAPDFNDKGYEPLLDEWKVMYDDGLFTPPTEGELNLDAPFVIAQSLFATISIPGVSVEREFAPLPGGRSQLNVNALAISAGSQHPEAAYRLIKYTTESSAAVSAFISAIPARKSLAGVEFEGEDSSNILSAFIQAPNAEEIAELEPYLDNAYSVAESLFTPHLTIAINKVMQESLSPTDALTDVEALALDGLQLAADRSTDTVISVATPVPDVAVVGEGEVALKFGVQVIFGGLQNQADWNTVAQEFADADPQVGVISVEALPAFGGGGLTTTAETYDCFYQSSNIVPTADLALILPIDPLINSDFNFNRDDVVAGALQQMRREDQTWGLPFHIQPESFWYNESVFNENGVFPPFAGWTVSDFETAMRQLKVTPDDTPPFSARGVGGSGTYLLTLMAAYGGLPLDYSTQPFTVNFTDEASVQAIQQVLELAREDYIKYNPLVQTGANILLGDATVYAMYSEILGGFFGGSTEDEEGNEYLLTMFPEGSSYKAVAYDVGAGYISASTENAEACYRFMTHLMTKIELFGGMPVLRSLINGSELEQTQGQDAVEYYNALDTLLQDPQTIAMPTGLDINAGGESLVTIWLYRAFDKYVEDESTDLVKELEDAQLFSNSYLECLAVLPEDAAAEGDILGQYRVWRDCAVKVDPSLASSLPAF